MLIGNQLQGSTTSPEQASVTLPWISMFGHGSLIEISMESVPEQGDFSVVYFHEFSVYFHDFSVYFHDFSHGFSMYFHVFPCLVMEV